MDCGIVDHGKVTMYMRNDERTLRMKERLAEALKKEMERKPMTSITVSDLVRKCDINRNTFYYHFRDIYALMEWAVGRELEELVKELDPINHTEQTIRYILDYLEKNRRLIDSAYNSLGYDLLQRYIFREIAKITKGVVEEAVHEADRELDDEFMSFVAMFYTQAISGMLIAWVQGHWSMEKEDVLKNMMLMVRSAIPALIEGRTKQMEQE